MAKQKITTEDTPQNETQPTQVEQTVPVEIPKTEQVEQAIATTETSVEEAPVKGKNSEKPSKATSTEAVEPDETVLNTLKKYPHYQALYVDRLGGVFTQDTPEKIRGNATLYKNPYFKP